MIYALLLISGGHSNDLRVITHSGKKKALHKPFVEIKDLLIKYFNINSKYMKILV